MTYYSFTIEKLSYSARFLVVENRVTAFYEADRPLVNVLGPETFPSPGDDSYTADNGFQNGFFSRAGINFTSLVLQNKLRSALPFFNVFRIRTRLRSSPNTLYIADSNEIQDGLSKFVLGIKIEKIMPPMSMGSLFSNNAQVYYKSHSLSSGSGGVGNYRAKQRRT
jgi:hypothetical protein